MWVRVFDPAAARRAALFASGDSTLCQQNPRHFAPRPGQRPGPTQTPYPRIPANACFAAAIVRCTSSSVCAAPRNIASYCDGGK